MKMQEDHEDHGKVKESDVLKEVKPSKLQGTLYSQEVSNSIASGHSRN